ncbi:hypothetical protein FBU30_002999 [Linnemannia zychae]|nr:hypothetical protein FBU30_002999 [Linnemannia zychae]
MAREVMHFPIFTGGPGQPTIKDFLDKTTDNLRKVVLEEKLFKTWHHGRVVLLGNACHKMNPTRGTGATNAIHDAITLANYIVSLPHWCEQKDIEHRLKAYQEERMPWIKESFESSNVFKIMAEKGFKASMIRLGSKALSGVVARTAMMKMSNNRPQVAFLKYIPDSGSVPSPYQPSYHFTINVLEDRAISDAEDEIRHREAKEAAIQRRDDISKQRTSIIHTSADPNSDTKAAIAHAAIVAEALSAANAAAYAAVTPKNALETFQTMSSKVKKPAVVLV